MIVPGWELVRSGRITGQPVAMGRPRMGNRRMYTPASSRKYLNESVYQISQDEGIMISDPVMIKMSFVFRRPKSLPKGWRNNLLDNLDPKFRIWKTTKPDIDNLEKMMLDSLVQGGAISDDNIVVKTTCAKYYGGIGEDPHAKYTIYRRIKSDPSKSKAIDIQIDKRQPTKDSSKKS